MPDYAHNTTIDMGDVPAKYVKPTANSKWGGILAQLGLSEVRFFYIPVNATTPSPDSVATDDVVLGWEAVREAVSGVKTHPDFQVTSRYYFDTTTANFPSIKS